MVVEGVVSVPTVNALAVVAPVDPGYSVPTPDCHVTVRGHDLYIAMISGLMEIRLGTRTGQVGKRLKALYSARYGSVAATNHSNMYCSRDRDIVEQAISDLAQT